MYNRASTKFKERIEGLHPKLILWLGYMLASSPVDFFISEGVRSDSRQKELYAKGRRGVAGEKVVTNVDGVNKKSKHQKQSDGYGHAVDIYYVGWSADKDPNGTDPRWKQLDECAKMCAEKLNIQMRHGRDWKSPYDPPHHELVL